MTGIDLAFDVPRNVADAVDVGDGGTAEFHYQTGHGKSLCWVYASTAHTPQRKGCVGAKARVCIAMRCLPCNTRRAGGSP
jgi:hypothetical protein